MAEFADLFEKSKLLIDNARGTMGVLVNSVTVYTSFWCIETATKRLFNHRLDN